MTEGTMNNADNLGTKKKFYCHIYSQDVWDVMRKTHAKGRSQEIILRNEKELNVQESCKPDKI